MWHLLFMHYLFLVTFFLMLFTITFSLITKNNTFIYVFSTYLWSTYYMPGTFLGSLDTAVNKQNSFPQKALYPVGGQWQTDNKKTSEVQKLESDNYYEEKERKRDSKSDLRKFVTYYQLFIEEKFDKNRLGIGIKHKG